MILKRWINKNFVFFSDLPLLYMAQSAYSSKREPMFKCLVRIEISLCPLKDVKFRCQN